MNSASTIVLAVSLIIIMFGMGLSLTTNDFKAIIVKPKAIIAGLISQLIFLPAMGFLLISIFDMPPEIAVGVIILTACPGGVTSNLVTHLAKGDTALSISLTAISSFLTILTIPFIINLGLQFIMGKDTSVQLNITQTIAQVFIVVIIPIIIGMTFRAKKTAFADKMQRPVRIASAIVFVLVMAGVIISERANIAPYFAQAGIITLTLNLLTMFIGFLFAASLRLSFKQGISISIESGIQNGTLAISIATILLGNQTYGVAPAIYSLQMFGTSTIIILWALWRSKKLKSA
jgi:BASS family bile acid:Na+ symporter